MEEQNAADQAVNENAGVMVICRPEEDENIQNSVYDGMNLVHPLKFIATGNPDGITLATLSLREAPCFSKANSEI